MSRPRFTSRQYSPARVSRSYSSVAQEEELAAVLRLYGEDAHFLRHGQDFQAGDACGCHPRSTSGVAGVGSVETVVEATEEGEGGF